MTAPPTSADFQHDTLSLPGGLSIAYRRMEGCGPGLIFLGGFKSDMTGSKASHLEAYATRTGRAFVRFDYMGHGLSSGQFEEGTIGHWGNDALAVLDLLTEGPQVLVGSSMGGWLMLLVALTRPERIAGLVGIAAAPDFTEDLIWDQLSPAERATLEREGRIEQPSDYGDEPYIITRTLVEEGRNHLLLRRPFSLGCPLRLLHGTEDADVPFDRSLMLMDAVDDPDVQVTLVKGGDHRLSDPRSLTLLEATLERLFAATG